jgi:hypothetical protein
MIEETAQTDDPLAKTSQKMDAPMVRHLIHQTIPHRRRRLLINPILPVPSEIIAFLDLIRPHALRNTDHPQKLVDIVT